MPRVVNSYALERLKSPTWLYQQHCVDHVSLAEISKHLAVTYNVVARAAQKLPNRPTQQTLREASLQRKYGVSNVSNIPAYRQVALSKIKDANSLLAAAHKRKQTNIDRHGTEHSGHLFSGKTRRAGRNNHISEAQWALLEDRDWLIHQHHQLEKPIYVIAKEVGVWDTTVAAKLDQFNIEKRKFYSSAGEKEIHDFLDSLGVIYCTRTKIEGKEIDIVIPSHNLGIEYCGIYWHSEQMGKTKYYHQNKLDVCEGNQIQLLTIFEDEWMFKKEIVKITLTNKLGMSRDKIYARNTKIRKVSKHQASKFTQQYHIQGAGQSSFDLGLFDVDDVLVAVLRLKETHKGLLINRYCSSIRVVGGFSKLLKYITSNNNYQSVYTFADRRWSNGNMYYKCGPTNVVKLQPDYSYAGPGCNGKRHHKFNFRHKHLSKRLLTYNNTLTERQNCDDNKLWRIWDCGKIRFEWK